MLTATASVFILGYLLIIFESKLKIDKAVSSILMAVIMWIIIAMNFDMTSKDHAHELVSILGDTAAILFFLLAAMTMVELIDLNNGFNQLSRWITTQSKTLLLLTITLISFFFLSYS